VQPDIPVDTFVASAYGLGFDGLLNFYRIDENILEQKLSDAFMAHTSWDPKLPYPYIVAASASLLQSLAGDLVSGITATANGFYGPQGRELRIPLAFPELNARIADFRSGGLRITNFEMETSALYALGKVLGHECLTICAIIANRVRKEYSEDYKQTIDRLIRQTLDRLTA
jgi:uridine phosphorylase